MSEPKPLASLSPSLLARKGSAKPAMRRQTPGLGLSPHLDGHGDFHDDLGWNDMGHDHVDAAPAVIAQPVPVMQPAVAVEQAPPPPPVVHQREELAQRLSEDTAKATVARSSKPKAGLARGRKAAFTLRIDPERHLKLRLACTIAGRSAQQLIIDALDEMTARIPEIEELASRMPRSASK